MAYPTPDRTVEGGWVGQCNRCSTVHGIERTVTVNSYGVLLKPGVYLGNTGNPARLCHEQVGRFVSNGDTRPCFGQIVQLADQEALVAAWHLGGWSAVRDILVARTSSGNGGPWSLP